MQVPKIRSLGSVTEIVDQLVKTGRLGLVEPESTDVLQLFYTARFVDGRFLLTRDTWNHDGAEPNHHVGDFTHREHSREEIEVFVAAHLDYEIG